MTCPGGPEGAGGPGGGPWCCCSCWFIICNLLEAVPSGAICGWGAAAAEAAAADVDGIPALPIPGDIGTTAAAAGEAI